MRIGKAIRIIEVEPLEDSVNTSTDLDHSDEEDPEEILLADHKKEVAINERVADLLPV